MINTAIIFGIVAFVPLLMSLTRFKVLETDNAAQKLIKNSMKKTQLVIALIFLITALIFLVLNFLITDTNTIKIVTITLYVISLVGSVAYAIVSQMKLQKEVQKIVNEK